MFGFLDRLRASPHRWCQSNLSAYIDRELSAHEHERVRRHLEECADCRRELQGLEHTVALLRQLPQARAPRSFYIPESAPAPSLPVWMRPWAYGALRLATVAAAALFVITVAGNALTMPAYLRSAAPIEAVSTEHAPAARAGQEVSTPAGDVLSVPAPEATAMEWGRGAGPAEEPTLTAEEAARKAAAPPGMGGGTEPPSPQPTAAPEMVAAAGQPTPEEPTQAPLAAVPEPTALAQSVEAPAEPGVAEDSGARSEAGPEQAADAYGARGLTAARLQLGRYPWRLWGAVTATLLAALAAATLWLRAARARWP